MSVPECAQERTVVIKWTGGQAERLRHATRRCGTHAQSWTHTSWTHTSSTHATQTRAVSCSCSMFHTNASHTCFTQMLECIPHLCHIWVVPERVEDGVHEGVVLQLLHARVPHAAGAKRGGSSSTTGRLVPSDVRARPLWAAQFGLPHATPHNNMWVDPAGQDTFCS